VTGRRAPRPKPATEQPGNSFRYLYWRLSEHEFQQLCGALLRHKYDPVQCYPVGMADGGIDAIARDSIIYQVKWSSKHEQSPAAWLDRAIEGERANIHRLVRDAQISRYILMTSVAGTTTAKRTGSIQVLNKKLRDYTREFGVPVECWWQSDIDAEVDAAPDAIKWSYQEMLAGSDAIRYLIEGSHAESDAVRMRDTVLHVMATQWRQDARIKFSQLDMDRISLVELFVDVQASLQAPPRNAIDQFSSTQAHRAYQTAGAVKYLLKTPVPLTYLLGVPGQGKSTLGQYLSQTHRAAILPGDLLGERKPPHESVIEPKLPLRVDLKDYAAWISGHDPFGEDEPPANPRRRPQNQRSLERFLAELCTAASGGRQVNVEQVQSLLERYPTLLVLDGLDEVADISLRRIVVEQINATAIRMAGTSRLRRFQILVTARPNSTGLPEPDKDVFQTLRLLPLTRELQDKFVNKWCDVYAVYGSERRKLRRIFQDRVALDHVAQLADNPMQLTILLFLIKTNWEAVPESRTPLYTDYLRTLLDREVTRNQIEPRQVPRVTEATSFLGWHMQSGVETVADAGRMSLEDIETTLLLYFRQAGNNDIDVEDLFKAVSDRFWALTSKDDGSFEFAVQPVREYFAARFLADWAGGDQRDPLPKQAVLRQLMGRTYWLNTARFYAGFANPNELAGLRYGIEDSLAAGRHPMQERVAVWALLSDSIFADAPRVQRDVTRLLTDDLSVCLIASSPEAAVNFPRLRPHSGGGDLSSLLMEELTRAPDSALASARVTMLRDRIAIDREGFRAWWYSKLEHAIGTDMERAWLRIGGQFGVPRLVPPATHRLTLADPESCQAALLAGASPEPDSAQARTLLRAVLDGWCSDVPTSSSSEAGALLRATRPQWYLQLDDLSRDGASVPTSHLWLTPADRSARSSAWTALVNLDSRYAALKQAGRSRAQGQKGTTEPWQNLARQLARLHGPCWLAAEIAVAGAATRDTLGSGSMDKDGQPFGDKTDYGTLVLEVHRRPNSDWWAHMYDIYRDPLSRRTWTLALLATATEATVIDHLDDIDAVLADTADSNFGVLAASSSRLGATRIPRRLGHGILAAAGGATPRTLLLLSHFACDLASLDPLSPLSDTDLNQLAGPEPAKWAIARAVTARAVHDSNATLLATLANLGPDTRIDLPAADTLDSEALSAILADPSRYPAAWVLAAERSSAMANTEDTMERVALAQRWVPRVPRI
jgi:hypothetical protein